MIKTVCLLICTQPFLLQADRAPLDLPAPYAGIELYPLQPDGWYGNEDYLQAVISHYSVQTVVEVGSWLGLSTQDIAKRLPAGTGKVFAVDHFLGSIEHQNVPYLPKLYDIFLSNMVQWEVAHIVVPVRMDSALAAVYLEGTSVDLVYLDASHDTESVLADMRAWWPYVKGHGVLCGDDATWPSVQAAVKIFAQEHDLKAYLSGNFWHLFEYRTPLQNLLNSNRLSYEKKLAGSSYRVLYKADPPFLDDMQITLDVWWRLPEIDWE